MPLGAKRSLFTTKNEGCNSTKKKRNDEVLFLRRMCTAEAKSSILKIKNIKNVNSCNREFAVISSTSGKSTYTVQICSTPSCSFPDFRKNGLRVFCKHLLFVLKYALQVDDDSMLKSRYFSEDDLKEILGHNTDSSYIQKVQKNRRTQQSLKDILQTHPLYHQPQEIKLIYKIGRSAKCHGRSCKAIISSGTLCFWVKGALTVPYGRNVAAKQNFYFCSTRKCLTNMPV